MMGYLKYEETGHLKLKFRVIEIDENKNGSRKNYKHKVTYPDEPFKDEWLFLDLKNKKYYEYGFMRSREIYEVILKSQNISSLNWGKNSNNK